MGNSCCSATDRKEPAYDDAKTTEKAPITSSVNAYFEARKETMQVDIRRLYELQLSRTNLLEFRIIRRELNRQAAEDLSILIPGFENLSDVSLVWTSLDARSCKIIAEGLKKAQKLENLCLNGNDIGDDGAVTLAETFTHLRRLRKLHLDINGIGDKGADALAQALPLAESLTFLSLQSNRISKKSLLALISAADTHPAMAEIHLQSNRGVVSLPPLTHVKVNVDLRA